MFRLCILWGFISLDFMQAYGQSLPRDANLREACRKQVAGQYLSTYDNHKQNQDYLSLLKKNRIKLEKSKVENSKQLAILKKKILLSRYDIKLNNELDQMESMASLLESSLKENLSLSKEATKKHDELTKKLEELKVRISQIFTFNKIKGKGKGVGYKFRIEYKDSCPPYRYSCPLPREKANKLTAIFEQDKVPLVCERYANFLNW